MKTKTLFITLTLSTLLTGCCLKHEYSEPSCTEPATCIKCGETEGEPLGHKWIEANCTEAKHCETCGSVEGEPLGHNLSEPTCTEASKCLVCNITQGQPLGHDFKEADYENPKTCQLCGLTEGAPKEKPSPEDITVDSSVEDMIAAYPNELTAEQKEKLDFYKKQAPIFGEEEYKKAVYYELYGPTEEERQAKIDRLLSEASEYGYIPYTETGDPEAFESLITTGKGAPTKEWDPNFQGSDNLKGIYCY